MLGPALWQPGRSEEGGPKAEQPQVLAVADAVVPELARARRPAVVADAPYYLLLDWRVNETQGPRPRVETPPDRLYLAGAGGELADWLRKDSCDLVVVVQGCAPEDRQPGRDVDFARLHAVLASSPDFALQSERQFPEFGGVTAEVWRLSGEGSRPAVVLTPQEP